MKCFPALMLLLGLFFNESANSRDSSQGESDYVEYEKVSINDTEIEQIKNKVYLDYQASTPCDPKVFAIFEWFLKIYGNPHATHANGNLLAKFIKRSRSEVAAVINAKPRNIYFTSGATESNNLAIKGIVHGFPKGSHIITSNIEHKSVLEVFKQLENDGYKVTYLKVDTQGFIDPRSLEDAITPDTKFVSIMMANSEIGTIQDIGALGSVCFKHNIIFHTDAAQSFGKVHIDVKKMRVDAMSISGHKIYAPKGVGALYLNVKSMKKKGLKNFIPTTHGGGQQNSIRPGTMATELIYALGLASGIAQESMESDMSKCATMQREIHEVLNNYNKRKKGEFIKSGGDPSEFEPVFVLNGPEPNPKRRLSCNLSYSIKGVDSADLIPELELRGFVISAGSACNADKSYSHVIEAIDPDMTLPPATVRISFGRFSQLGSGAIFAETLIRSVEYLQHKFPNKGVRACDKTKKGAKIEASLADESKEKSEPAPAQPKTDAEKEDAKEAAELKGFVKV